jgi:plasmid stability protein
LIKVIALMMEIPLLASITIRNLDQPLKARLRIQAARHGRSMEEEARDILRTALSQESVSPTNLAAAIRARFAPLGGVDLPEVPREPMREPPDFGV